MNTAYGISAALQPRFEAGYSTIRSMTVNQKATIRSYVAHIKVTSLRLLSKICEVRRDVSQFPVLSYIVSQTPSLSLSLSLSLSRMISFVARN
jgi:hypothetical protein